MKSARGFALVLVTAPDLKTARLLARAALNARLVACVNLVPQVGIGVYTVAHELLERFEIDAFGWRFSCLTSRRYSSCGIVRSAAHP